MPENGDIAPPYLQQLGTTDTEVRFHNSIVGHFMTGFFLRKMLGRLLVMDLQ